jgi:hypothetical protein
MSPGRFDALEEESSEDEDQHQTSAIVADVPSHEDLSLSRADEETVLTAVYGEDFHREKGVWGCARLCVHVRPPDAEQVISQLT